MSYEELTELERTILYYCGKANNFSQESHVPKAYFLNKVKRIVSIKERLIDRAFNRPITQGFIQKHPTRGEVTYHLTPKGLNGAIRAQEELDA